MSYFIQLQNPGLISVSSFAQERSSCGCSGLLAPDYNGYIFLYDKPNGQFFKKIKNDTANEDYLVFDVDNENGDYFHCKFTFFIAGKTFTGWVKKSQYLGVYARNYNSRLSLYSDTNLKSKVKSVVPEWDNTIYPFIHCSKKWVYVKKSYKKQAKEGWLAPEMQCANPYTTCN